MIRHGQVFKLKAKGVEPRALRCPAGTVNSDCDHRGVGRGGDSAGAHPELGKGRMEADRCGAPSVRHVFRPRSHVANGTAAYRRSSRTAARDAEEPTVFMSNRAGMLTVFTIGYEQHRRPETL